MQLENTANHRINNDPYVFSVVLYNGKDDALKAQPITPTSIKELVLEDNFYNYYHKGYIVIDNRFDAIERTVNMPLRATPTGPGSSATQPASDRLEQSPGFIFMGDARDYIDIKIMPTGENNELLTKKAQRFLGIFIQGAIYAVEEVATDTPDVKFKKLYFWDKYYELLREKSTSWSTVEVVENKLGLNKKPGNRQTPSAVDSNISAQNPEYAATLEELKSLKVKNVVNFSNEQRQIPSGEAIKYFLAAALPEREGYPALFPSQSFEQEGDVTPQPTLRADDVNWDVGSSTLFFSTPAKFKNHESLQYMLEGHISGPETLYDQSFLRIHRFFRCFTFKPLSTYFKQAYEGQGGGPLYAETILLGGYTSDSEGNIWSRIKFFTPKIERFQLPQSGSTINYALEPSLGNITQKMFNTKFIHSYNQKDKQFNIDIAENNMEKIMETYQKNYVETIKTGTWANIVPGKNRVDNKNIEHFFSVIEEDQYQRLARGRNKALYTAIFANNQVKFRVPGSTIRQAGVFIGVNREGSAPINLYDNKILGIYFVTEVKHIFEGNTYITEVTCIKTYTELQIFPGQVGPNNQNINNQIIT